VSTGEGPLAGLDVTPLSSTMAPEERAAAKAHIVSASPEFVPAWPWGPWR
jgi:hypothetical protein